MNASTKIFNKTVKNSVDIERFTASLKKDVNKLLIKLQGDLIAQISRIDPTKNISAAKRKQRLEKLNKEVDAILEDQYGKIKKTSIDKLKNFSSYQAEVTGNILNSSIGADVFDVRLSNGQLEAIVDHTLIDGQISGDWWNEQKDDFKNSFRKQMADATQKLQVGTAQGEGVQELYNRIKGTDTFTGLLETSRKKAFALIRTSTMQVANEASFKMFENNEEFFEGYEFVATLDLATTDICRALDRLQWKIEDGEYIPIGHDEPWPGNPPLHFNCRSRLMPIVKSFSKLAGKNSKLSDEQIKKLEDKLDSESKRSALYGPVEGKTNYNSWLKSQSEKDQIEVLGVTKQKLWKENKLSMSDLINQDGSPRTV